MKGTFHIQMAVSELLCVSCSRRGSARPMKGHRRTAVVEVISGHSI